MEGLKKYGFILGLVIIIGLMLLGFSFKKKTNKGNENICFPQIHLRGNKIITLNLGENYEEPGYTLKDSCGENVDNRLEIKNTVDNTKPGTYEVFYKVNNQYGNVAEEKRFVTVKGNKNVTYLSSYDKIDNQVRGWGVPNKKDGKRPTEVEQLRSKLTPYNAYFIGEDEKVLYLTFDEGSNDTYLKEIVDVLNQNDVKATFFFCKRYILDNPELMKTLVQYGHSVGNHTANHKSMPTLANATNFKEYLQEIIAVEEAFMQVTGNSMDRIYREPKGEYSYRSLQMIKDLGYKTYFWSIAYVDFQETLSKEKALQEMTSRVHNGAIYLMHPKNKGNYEALSDFIKQMKEQGYRFDLVKNIKMTNAE